MRDGERGGFLDDPGEGVEQHLLAAGAVASPEVVDDAIREGAVLRVRPKAMTVAVILAGLVPIVWGSGTGSEVMSRIAAPMLGGMVTAPLLSLFVIPAAYRLMRRRKPRHADSASPVEAPAGSP